MRSVSTSGERPSATAATTSLQMSWLRTRSSDQLRIQGLKFDAAIFGRSVKRTKIRRTDVDGMFKGTHGSLMSGIDSIANWSALHEDDGMMSVFSSQRGGQAGHEFGLRLTDDLLKAGSGQMMAFIYDEMSIISHEIAHKPFRDKL